MKQSKWDLDEAEAMFWIAIEAGYSFMGGMKKVYGFGLSRNAVIFYDNGLFKWYTLTQELINIGNKCLEKFKDKDDWYWLSVYQNLSEAFIEKFQHKVNWNEISCSQKLSEKFIEKFKDDVDWNEISKYQKVSEKFIEKSKK